MSWVLAGGVFAAVIGPQLVIFTKDLLPPYMFAASYLGQSACALLAAVVLMFVKMPPLAAARVENARPLAEIVRTPRFIVAVACGMASYAMMNMMMTSAPLAMVGCGHSVTDATLGIQWHVLAMYAPSFVTGSLIARFGVERITGIGLALIGAGRGGRHRRHHGGAFLDRAGAARRRLEFGLHRRHHHGDPVPPAEERNKVQAFNDFLIFGSMAVGSFSSGQMLEYLGWTAINEVIFPTIFVVGAMLVWLALGKRAVMTVAGARTDKKSLHVRFYPESVTFGIGSAMSCYVQNRTQCTVALSHRKKDRLAAVSREMQISVLLIEAAARAGLFAIEFSAWAG